jgi:hypothetical protein
VESARGHLSLRDTRRLPSVQCRTGGQTAPSQRRQNQRLYLKGTRVAQVRDTLPIDLNSAALGIGRHVSGIADPLNGHIDEFRISQVQRSDGCV